MASFETTGGGTIDSGDKRIERKVLVSTDGTDPSAPGGTGRLTNITITQEPGGVRRGIFEYTQGGAGGASYDVYGKRIELMGGTREVPIQTHPAFKALTETQLAQVETAIDNKEDDLWRTGPVSGGTFNAAQQVLYNFLRRKVEYVLAPAVVGRVSEFSSSLPSLSPVGKVADPSELTAPTGTFWVCTAVTASPVGGKYEVTTEYTLNFSDWSDVETLYGWT